MTSSVSILFTICFSCFSDIQKQRAEKKKYEVMFNNTSSKLSSDAKNSTIPKESIGGLDQNSNGQNEMLFNNGGNVRSSLEETQKGFLTVKE